MYILELIQGRAFNFAFRKLSLYLISNLTLCSSHFRIINQAEMGQICLTKKLATTTIFLHLWTCELTPIGL